MRIIHITPYFPPDIGGIETYVYEVTKRLSRYCDVEVFTCGGGFTKEVAGVVVHRLRAIDIRDMPFHLKIPYPIPPTLLFHAAMSDADIIHVHGHAFATTLRGLWRRELLKSRLL